ncbi:hypothetical protein XELAEV_18017090mg [Xenopus laevis]|uniref:GIY-YIG domain-containing protein n=1 Tax=Xenopus laevis TaxID=8355 RepID=A0A974HSB9_XENLA|nr:hypothetical protein XELAEV_18017090mg [Xenopus laevis]
MYPCIGCTHCHSVIRGKEFVHPGTGYRVKLWGHYTCMSKYVIYALTCPCGYVYIGETTKMVKSRISQHKFSINLGNRTQVETKEGVWIHKLKTLVPHELNRDYDLYLFL